MNTLDTKSKGDIGLTKVIADLTEKGFNVALPIAEHLPYDLIAIDSKHRMTKVSVKYVTSVNGTITIPLRSISTNMQGWKAKTIDFSLIGGFAVYCPDTKLVYYIASSTAKDKKSTFLLRVENPIRNIAFNSASDFLDPTVLWTNE